MRLILASALTLVSTAAFADPGHSAPEGPLHGLAHAPGDIENLLAIGVVATIIVGGALLLANLARKQRNRR